jgi:hypothetical protein
METHLPSGERWSPIGRPASPLADATAATQHNIVSHTNGRFVVHTVSSFQNMPSPDVRHRTLEFHLAAPATRQQYPGLDDSRIFESTLLFSSRQLRSRGGQNRRWGGGTANVGAGAGSGVSLSCQRTCHPLRRPPAPLPTAVARVDAEPPHHTVSCCPASSYFHRQKAIPTRAGVSFLSWGGLRQCRAPSLGGLLAPGGWQP